MRSMQPLSSTTPTGCYVIPFKRAEYLLAQEGFDIGEQRSKDVPPELLEEVFELNMLLEETPERESSSELRRNSRSCRRHRDGTRVLVRAIRFFRRS